MAISAPAKISAPAISWDSAFPFIAVLAAWGALYLPVYFEFAAGPWRRPENAHAPFIMAIAAGIAWSIVTRADFRCRAGRAGFLAGALVAAAGLCIYSAGRLAGATALVSASQSLVALGVALGLYGAAGAFRLAFPLALTLYLVIWPSWALEALTAPLKRFVSGAVSEALFAAGLPVAHAGAVITAGPYQLLVADACSGLNSLIALTAVGAVFMYAIRRRSLAVNIAVLLSLVPIAVTANIARVTILVLITYRFGYDAGQSFLHESAGLAMFSFALGAVFAVDWLAAVAWERRR
jgi:exosortase